jgi:hypothetical protein
MRILDTSSSATAVTFGGSDITGEVYVSSVPNAVSSVFSILRGELTSSARGSFPELPEVPQLD